MELVMQAAILCDQAGHIFIPFPFITRPWRSCEPSRQTKQISSSPHHWSQDCWVQGQLLPSLQAVKVSDTQTTRWRWWPCHRTGKRNSTQSTIYKIKQLQVLNEEPALELLLDSKTPDPWWPGIPPLTPASSKDQVSGLDSFTRFSSLDHDCYTDKANHVLRSDPTWRGSRWL